MIFCPGQAPWRVWACDKLTGLLRGSAASLAPDLQASGGQYSSRAVTVMGLGPTRSAFRHSIWTKKKFNFGEIQTTVKVVLSGLGLSVQRRGFLGRAWLNGDPASHSLSEPASAAPSAYRRATEGSPIRPMAMA